MQFKTLLFASLATVVLGQTATTSASTTTQTSTCAAQNVLDACVSQTKGQVNSCNSTDWDCLCTAWGVVLTCYNNCPGDANVFSVQQTRDSYCNAASAYGTKTSSAISTSHVAAATLSTSTASGTTHSGTATGSAATSASTHNAASHLQVGSGMVVVALAGLGLLA